MPQLIGAAIGLYIAYLVIVYIIIPGFLVITGIGALFGLIISLYNYGLAFKHNVKREGPIL